MASVLFSAPIGETSVIRTFKCFEKHGVPTPEKVLETGWQGLVTSSTREATQRYDFKTSDKLLEAMSNLTAKYGGSLNLLHKQASESHDLGKRLKNLGKGIGDVTVSIFLRELRDVWEKADPKPSSYFGCKKFGDDKTGKL